MAGELPAEERRLAETLDSRRPLPAPAFRGNLGRRLALLNPGYGHRPAHLWTTAISFGLAGTLLIAIGAAAAGLL
jgi:hypothetical protein